MRQALAADGGGVPWCASLGHGGGVPPLARAAREEQPAHSKAGARAAGPACAAREEQPALRDGDAAGGSGGAVVGAQVEAYQVEAYLVGGQGGQGGQGAQVEAIGTCRLEAARLEAPYQVEAARLEARQQRLHAALDAAHGARGRLALDGARSADAPAGAHAGPPDGGPARDAEGGGGPAGRAVALVGAGCGGEGGSSSSSSSSSSMRLDELD